MAKRKTQVVDTEKLKKVQALEQKLQEFASKHKFELMSELMNKWNKSNKEKITQMVKMDNSFNIHFNGLTVRIIDETMRLG